MKCTREDILIIRQIAERAVIIATKAGHEYSKTDAIMDLMAAHEDCPLRLQELLAADLFDFGHDVFGINRHLNRRTLKLEDCFVPRYVA